MKGFKLNELFAKCAKEVIPNIDEGGVEYDMLPYDIDEHGPICSDSVLMTVFRNNITEHITDNELYKLIEQVCLVYTNKCNSKK